MQISTVDSHTQNRSLFQASGRISVLFGCGVAAKLTVDFVLMAKFGLGFQTDAFFVAYTIPLIFESLIYPACQYGFVPVFIRYMVPGKLEGKQRLFSALFYSGWMVSSLFSVTGILGASVIVLVIAPGLDPVSHALAVRLTRILFIGSLFVGPIGVMRAYLNAHNHFTAPAMYELIRGLTAIIIILLTSQYLGIESVALGFTTGLVLLFTILVIAVLLEIGFDFRWAMDLPLIKSSRALRLFMVHIGNFLIIQSVMIIQRVVGSFLPAGSISAISYGDRMASVIGTLLFSGVEVVSLSSLAVDFVKATAEHLQKAKQTLQTGLRLVLILGIPVAAGIFIFRYPLTRILFERGEFDYTDTLLAAPVLGIFALSIPFYGHWLLLVNYLYAATKPRMIIALAAIFTAMNLVLSIPLSRAFGASGLAVTYVVGFGTVFFASFLLLSGELGTFQQSLFGLAGKVIGASIGMWFVIHSVGQFTLKLFGSPPRLPSKMLLLVYLLFSGLCGISFLFGELLFFRVEEAAEFMNYLKRRRFIKLSSQENWPKTR